MPAATDSDASAYFRLLTPTSDIFCCRLCQSFKSGRKVHAVADAAGAALNQSGRAASEYRNMLQAWHKAGAKLGLRT